MWKKTEFCRKLFRIRIFFSKEIFQKSAFLTYIPRVDSVAQRSCADMFEYANAPTNIKLIMRKLAYERSH